MNKIQTLKEEIAKLQVQLNEEIAHEKWLDDNPSECLRLQEEEKDEALRQEYRSLIGAQYPYGSYNIEEINTLEQRRKERLAVLIKQMEQRAFIKVKVRGCKIIS